MSIVTKHTNFTVEFTKKELVALLHFLAETSTTDSLAKGLTKEESDTIFLWFCKIDKEEVENA